MKNHRMSIFLSFILLLHLSFCSNVTRIFMHESSLPNQVDTIINFVEVEYSFKLEKKVIGVAEGDLEEVIKEVSDVGNDTIFAYLPNVNVTLLNEIAKKYNMYIWNAVELDVHVCLSNVILGYDVITSSLLGINIYI